MSASTLAHLLREGGQFAVTVGQEPTATVFTTASAAQCAAEERFAAYCEACEREERS